MELVKLGEKTYVIKNNTNIGIYLVNDKDVYIIDTGIDRDCGKKILKIITDNGWNIKRIINTHSNADHVGGNKIIQEKTGCKIYSKGLERVIIENPELEPIMLCGSYPLDKLKNKFVMAEKSNCEDISKLEITGLEWFSLLGHYIDMIGIRTSDNVYFIGDSVFDINTINKYHICFIYDVDSFLKTLNYLEKYEGMICVPSHGEITSNIKDIIKINRDKVLEICEVLIDICSKEIIFEEILREVFKRYNLHMNELQYYLVGGTIKSYLVYLYNNKRVEYIIKDNYMYWNKIENMI